MFEVLEEFRHAVSQFLSNLDNFLPLDQDCYKFVVLWKH